MIDWLAFSMPYSHTEMISDGTFMSLNSTGEIEYTVPKKMPLRGSHETNVHVKTDRNSYDPITKTFTQLHVDGNPTKWIQGHNLFGTDDVLGLAIETALKIYGILKLNPSAADLSILYSGDFPLHRVDINYSFELGNQHKVLAFIKAMENQAHMRHRGTGIMSGKTLYFGKNSRRWSVKMYSKGEEISSRKKGHQLNPVLGLLDSLRGWADGKLRIELTLRSLQLKDTGFATASKWGENTPLMLFQTYLEPLNMSKQQDLSSDAIIDLPARLKPVYALWKTGHDLRSSYSSSTFYRHRASLLKHGIDIAIIQPSTKQSIAEVIPFIQIIDGVQLSGVPSWAVGTDLYFEPRFYG
jgi:II/X family phage/plasmid replication protein